MKMSRNAFALGAALCFFAGYSPADESAVNPQVVKIMNDVSDDRIKATIEKLVSFGTRNTMSNTDTPGHGVGAARQWIFDQFKSYSPRLEVRFDKFRVKKQGMRIFKDVDLYDVIAVLPGKTMPETQVWITGHYDSLNLGNRPAAGAAPAAGAGTDAAGGGAATTPQLTPADYEKNAELPAPGACDDGSGTSAVMELARVMSQYEFDKTIVFAAFAGEEQGLVGSQLEAEKAKAANTVIEALLNNDIIGTDVSGTGRTGNSTVNVYSDETMDSPSQELSRYIRDIGERYMPAMHVNNVFMGDRLGRGGDHTPFQWEGYAAVRFSTPLEIYANQHHATDTLENMSVPYTARVARMNGVVAASLAMSPKAPIVFRAPGGRNGAGGGTNAAGGTNAGGGAAGAAATGAASGGTANAGSTTGGTPGAAGRGADGTTTPGAGGRRPPTPLITRGRTQYDAQLQWRASGPDAAIKGYVVVVRPTTAPYWEQQIYVGKVTEFLMKDVSIDDLKFGIKAIGTNGSESLVTPYLYPPRVKAPIELVQQ
jgi:Peptidase family M28